MHKQHYFYLYSRTKELGDAIDEGLTPHTVLLIYKCKCGKSIGFVTEDDTEMVDVLEEKALVN